MIERFGKVGRLLPARRLQGHIDFPVGAHLADVAFHAVARMHILKYLVFIEQAGKAVVHNHLEAEVGLLPHKQLHFITGAIGRTRSVEKLVDLGRSHDAVTLLVDVDIHDMAVAYHHLSFHLVERTKEVFHQSPTKKSPVFIHPFHFQIGKVSHLGQRFLGGGDGAFVLVEIDETLHLVARLQPFGHIALGHEDVSLAASVEIHAEHLAIAFAAGNFFHAQPIVFAKSRLAWVVILIFFFHYLLFV